MGQVALVPKVGLLVPVRRIGLEVFIGNLQGHVGDGAGVVEEEGLVRVVADEVLRALDEEVRGVGPALEAIPASCGVRCLLDLLMGGEHPIARIHPFAVVPQVIGVVVVGLGLAQIAKELIESLEVGLAALSRSSQAPLAKGSRGVAALLQQASEGGGSCGQGHLAFAMGVVLQAEGAEVRHGQLATSRPVVIGVEQVIPETVDDPGRLVETDPVPFGQGLDDPRTVDRLIRTDELDQREGG